ncbi:glutathione S-transferase family protein [Alcanivorax sediminis]|uniref:Glutathione S-transferase family protein n=1 Tax=Alcanivorax sediminis TaxID=2663008 RepID=A0A6N7LW63_9GAMM|nr:glutathione S-transferase family protein [Alcanivorax sediminis]MQX54677.1 glutathione S-transferase family protein [Alcanivorax sediminis]
MRIYGDSQSGNCYKVKLVCHLLEREYEWVEVDILAGETRSPDFLSRNANGKIPLLDLGDDGYLAESNAIINYLAAGSALYPADALTQARIQQWQFFEQYSHEPFIAVARFINKYLGLPPGRADEYAAKQEGGHKALQVMERQLHGADYLVGDVITTADLALYAYTHVAHEGGFDLTTYPGIQAWLGRVASQPGFTEM